MSVRCCNVTGMDTESPPRGSNVNDRAAATIRGHMAQQKKSTTALGKILGISRQAAGRKASGATAISLQELHTIAAWLGVQPAELLKAGTTQ